MKTQVVEFREIAVTMLIRADWYDQENLNEVTLKERIQSGIEIPIETIQVEVL